MNGRNGNGPTSTTARDPASRADSSPDLDSLLQGLRTDMRGIYDSLRRVVFVEWQRLRMRAVDTYFRFIFYTCLLGFALAASISASLLVVSGIKSGLHVWSGVEWIGDFGAGALIIAVLLGGGFAVRAHLRREIVRDTKRALAGRSAKHSARNEART